MLVGKGNISLQRKMDFPHSLKSTLATLCPSRGVEDGKSCLMVHNASTATPMRAARRQYAEGATYEIDGSINLGELSGGSNDAK